MQVRCFAFAFISTGVLLCIGCIDTADDCTQVLTCPPDGGEGGYIAADASIGHANDAGDADDASDAD